MITSSTEFHHIQSYHQTRRMALRNQNPALMKVLAVLIASVRKQMAEIARKRDFEKVSGEWNANWNYVHDHCPQAKPLEWREERRSANSASYQGEYEGKERPSRPASGSPNQLEGCWFGMPLQSVSLNPLGYPRENVSGLVLPSYEFPSDERTRAECGSGHPMQDKQGPQTKPGMTGDSPFKNQDKPADSLRGSRPNSRHHIHRQVQNPPAGGPSRSKKRPAKRTKGQWCQNCGCELTSRERDHPTLDGWCFACALIEASGGGL